MTNKETPLFFKNGEYRLFGVLHEPVSESPKSAFVFCHAFAEEKLWAHRVFVSFARELARRNYAVLRFDHFGHGDSQGSFSEATVERYISDIKAAVDFVRTKISTLGSVSLLGHRLGATLAAQVAEAPAKIEELILWDPIVDGERYMQDVLRINLTTQLAVYGEVKTNRQALVELMQQGEAVNVDGYEMTLPMFQQISSLNLLSSKEFDGDCLVVQIGKSQQPYKKDIVALKDSYRKGFVTRATEAPFWREIKESYFRAPDLYEATLNWLEKRDVRA